MDFSQLIDDSRLISKVDYTTYGGTYREYLPGEAKPYTGLTRDTISSRNETIIRQYRDGLYHNEDGPAVCWFDQSGNCFREQYYLKGKFYSEENYRKAMIEYKKTFGYMKRML